MTQLSRATRAISATCLTYSVMLLTAPLLIVQGKWVRRTALKLAEPAGLRHGYVPADTQATSLRLLVLGDSAAAGVGCEVQSTALAMQVAQHLSKHTQRPIQWQLVAQSGQTCKSIETLLREQTHGTFDYAIVSLGVNDITSQYSLKSCMVYRERLHTTLTQDYGVKHWVHSALPPVSKFPLLPQPLRWVLGRQAHNLDAALVAWAMHTHSVSICQAFDLNQVLSENIHPINQWMAADGFHPGVKAYALWAQQLASHLAKFCHAHERALT